MTEQDQMPPIPETTYAQARRPYERQVLGDGPSSPERTQAMARDAFEAANPVWQERVCRQDGCPEAMKLKQVRARALGPGLFDLPSVVCVCGCEPHIVTTFRLGE